MIAGLGLKNIRLFRDDGIDLTLTPLTVFCGTNSSGKTTILKTLLLLRQSQELAQKAGDRPVTLHFTGPDADLGSYRTFVSDGKTERSIEITIRVSASLSSKSLEPLSEIAFEPGKQPIDLLSNKATIEAKFIFDSNLPLGPHSLMSTRGRSFKPQGILSLAQYTLKVGQHDLLEWTIHREKKERDFSHYTISFSSKYFEMIGGERVIIPERTDDGKFVRFDVRMDGLFPSGIKAKQRPSEPLSEPEDKWYYFVLPRHIDQSLADIRDALDRIHYIAPLRSAAKRYYLQSYDSLPALDSAGDFLPFMLAHGQEYKVTHTPPGANEPKTERLASALGKWLYFLRTGEAPEESLRNRELIVSTPKDVLIELQLPPPTGHGHHALADSGFGYSQVLPIIARGLLAEPGDMLIIEQPELHLNPSLQVRLAEFFASIASMGKQLLIETHSEHMVNALRVLIAERRLIRQEQETSHIYYLKSATDTPRLLELSIKDDGTVPGWPAEFFGEAASLAGRLLRLSTSLPKVSR